MTSVVNRERIKITLAGHVPDAVAVSELVYWPETIERWCTEGLPVDAPVGEYFGTDAFAFLEPDLSLQLEERTLEQDNRLVFQIDANGVVQKRLLNSYAPPQPVRYSVEDRKTWSRLAPRLHAGQSRLPPDLDAWVSENRAKHRFIAFKVPEPCWASTKVLGTERLLIAMLEDPQWIHGIFETYAQLTLDLYRLLKEKGVQFDGAWLNGDLCYKSGMLFSPAVYRRLLLPYHRRLCAFFQTEGLPIVTHCCGDVRQLIPLYIEAGFTAIQPLEARAGNDVRVLKRQYGTGIVLIGNISTDVLGQSKDKIEEEVRSKLTVAKQGGGYIFHSDHSIPPTVSLDHYRYALGLVKRYG